MTVKLEFQLQEQFPFEDGFFHANNDNDNDDYNHDILLLIISCFTSILVVTVFSSTIGDFLTPWNYDHYY